MVVGVLTDLWPFTAFPLAAVTVVALAVLTLVKRPLNEYRLAEVAGVMLGLGELSLYGVARGLVICGRSDDFYGNANLLPLASLTGGLIVYEALAAAVVYIRRTRRRAASRRDGVVDD